VITFAGMPVVRALCRKGEQLLHPEVVDTLPVHLLNRCLDVGCATAVWMFVGYRSDTCIYLACARINCHPASAHSLDKNAIPTSFSINKSRFLVTAITSCAPAASTLRSWRQSLLTKQPWTACYLAPHLAVWESPQRSAVWRHSWRPRTHHT
jgi:hypothetical protein